MSADRIDALSRSLADSTSRRSLLRLLGVGVAGTAIAGTAVAGVGLPGAQAKTYHKLHNISVSDEGGGKRFRGKLSVQRFEPQGQGLVAIAKLTGTVTEKDGKGKQRVSEIVELPVSLPGIAELQGQATCEILDLVLGPLDLRLLGLHVHIDRIHIRVTATQGALLGDLLCAIADLLNGGNVLGKLAEIANLLTQLVAALRSL